MRRIDHETTGLPLSARLASGMLFGLLFALGAPRSFAAESFNVEILNQDHVDWLSLAFDAQDEIHLAYRYHANYDFGLEYGRKTAGGWTFEAVPMADGYYVSLVVDAEGAPHLAYFDPGNPMPLRYASRSASGWTAETIELVGEPGQVTVGNTSLALDATGRPHVAYTVNGALKYAEKTLGGWVVETLDASGSPEIGRRPSLALDGQGNPRIAYSDVSGLVLARRQSSSWAFETVDAGGGLFSSLDLDASGSAHVSYYDGASGALKYASQNAQGWNVEIPDNAGGGSTSLVLRANGDPRIGYQDGNGVLKYASKVAGAWTTATVDASSVSGRELSLALDSAGRPAVAYEFHTRYGRRTELRYAQAQVSPTDVAGARGRGGAWLDPVRPSPTVGTMAHLSFRLPQRDVVTVELFDVRGRVEAVRPPENYAAGEHFVSWDTGTRPAGLYFVRLKTASGSVAQQHWTRLR